jgi:HSP20 family molecular chaperone IbpA
MGIMDKVTALLPGRGARQERSAAAFDAVALRDDLERWVQRFFDEPGAFGITDFPGAPFPEVQETDDEVVVKAQVPGLDREDIDLTITDAGLTITRERRDEQRDERKGTFLTEARYARVVQTVPLPPGIDVDRAQARVERGVLTVRFPKTEAHPAVRRVPVTA